MVAINRDQLMKVEEYGVNGLGVVGALGAVCYLGRKVYTGKSIIDGNKPNNSIGNVLWNMANTVKKASEVSTIILFEVIGLGVAAYFGRQKECAIVLLRADMAALGLKTIHVVYKSIAARFAS